MECRINIGNQKIKIRQGPTWVISVKDIPNINLSCINNGMVSSCYKNSVDKFETAPLYKWIYYIPDGESYESHAWYETFDQCEEDALCNVNTYCQDKDVIHLYIYR